jgi:hypothetical protein
VSCTACERWIAPPVRRRGLQQRQQCSNRVQRAPCSLCAQPLGGLSCGRFCGLFAAGTSRCPPSVLTPLAPGPLRAAPAGSSWPPPSASSSPSSSTTECRTSSKHYQRSNRASRPLHPAQAASIAQLPGQLCAPTLPPAAPALLLCCSADTRPALAPCSAPLLAAAGAGVSPWASPQCPPLSSPWEASSCPTPPTLSLSAATWTGGARCSSPSAEPRMSTQVGGWWVGEADDADTRSEPG